MLVLRRSLLVISFFYLLLVAIHFNYGWIHSTFVEHSINNDERMAVSTVIPYREKRLQGDSLLKLSREIYMPLGYKAVYYLTATFIHPRDAAEVFTVISLALFHLLIGYYALKTQGLVSALVAMTLSLCSYKIVSEGAGGLPRTFAWPVLALGYIAIFYSRPLLIIFSVVAAVLFYPTVALVVAVSAIFTLLAPKSLGGIFPNWSIKKKGQYIFLLCFLLGVIGSVQSFPLLESGGMPTLSVEDYPETGPGGRNYFPVDKGFWEMANTFKHELYFRPKENLLGNDLSANIIAVLIVSGFCLSLFFNNGARRALIFIVALFVLHQLSAVFLPSLYFPNRYRRYPMVAIALLLVPFIYIGYSRLLEKLRVPKKFLSPLLSTLVLGLLIFWVSGERSSHFKERHRA